MHVIGAQTSAPRIAIYGHRPLAWGTRPVCVMTMGARPFQERWGEVCDCCYRRPSRKRESPPPAHRRRPRLCVLKPDAAAPVAQAIQAKTLQLVSGSDGGTAAARL